MTQAPQTQPSTESLTALGARRGRSRRRRGDVRRKETPEQWIDSQWLPARQYEATEPWLVVVGFDPGGTTGWAVARMPMSTLFRVGLVAALHADPDAGWTCGHFRGPENDMTSWMVHCVRRGWQEVDSVGEDLGLGGGGLLLVAQERFNLRMMSMDASLLSPVRIMAKFEYAMKDAGVVVVGEAPGDAKRVISDGRLASWSMYKAGSVIHDRDALRQAVLTARKFGSDSTFRGKVGWSAGVPTN